ncbi:MAG TPA: cation-translocating P-type ATPase C-terminal domain-containing protein [Microlunatus sp.]
MPFALWALSGGQFPLAIGVLQVLALDIGTDMLPALALGAEPPSRRIMDGRAKRAIVHRSLILRAFTILGGTEAACAMAAFTFVLVGHDWQWGTVPTPGLLAMASGTAFAAISLGQMANAFACRSTSIAVWRQRLMGNRLLLGAVAIEVCLLLALLGIPGLSTLLGSDSGIGGPRSPRRSTRPRGRDGLGPFFGLVASSAAATVVRFR